MSSINADPAALRSTQPSFDAVASTITTAVDKLAAALAAEGECWGGDEIGQAFAQNYTPGVEKGKTSVGNLAKSMTQLGTNMVTIATKLSEQDTATAAQLNQTGI
ncbi:WXG100 family type VII secretion target [Nocardia sp. NPDC057663]|uniref:WXG100 family type VII secretion target n=1 Tax=Nocardia sp. NPDC057663 TaxID=3346201 RepID=UPI00366CE7C9